MTLYLWLFIFISLILYAIFVVVKYSRKKKLSPTRYSYFKKHFLKLTKEYSGKHLIIDLDKLYHKILQDLGYYGSFWEILKREPNEVWDLQEIWRLHKIRNKLVHDLDDHDEKWLNHQALLYSKQVEKLFQAVK